MEQGLSWDEASSLIVGFLFGIRCAIARVFLVKSIEMCGLWTLSVLSSKLASACSVQLFVKVQS